MTHVPFLTLVCCHISVPFPHHLFHQVQLDVFTPLLSSELSPVRNEWSPACWPLSRHFSFSSLVPSACGCHPLISFFGFYAGFRSPLPCLAGVRWEVGSMKPIALTNGNILQMGGTQPGGILATWFSLCGTRFLIF